MPAESAGERLLVPRYTATLDEIIRQKPESLDGHYLHEQGKLTDERTLTVHRSLGWTVAGVSHW